MNKDEALRLALEAARQWIGNAPHGDNCFLHDEGEYNCCFCGKDSIENHIDEVLEQVLEQPEQEPVALPEKIYEFVPTPEPLAWHHPECEGECIACLIERAVQESYGSQGLGYLQRHLATRPQVREPLTDEQKEILNFLLGSSGIDNFWFGDKHPTEKGQFWWRNRLRKAFQEVAHGIGENHD